MICSMIILIFILCSNFSTLCFKFKTGLHVKIYHSSLATCRREWLLRMIPSVCLFTNVHGVQQQQNHKLYLIDLSSYSLHELEDSGGQLQPYSWLPSLYKKWSFPLRISSVNVTQSAVSCNLVTFTEEILNGKFHFLCSAYHSNLWIVSWNYLKTNNYIIYDQCAT